MTHIGFNVQIGVTLDKFRADMNSALQTLNTTTAQMERSLASVSKAFGGLESAVFSLKSALITLGAYRVFDFGKNLVSEFEKSQSAVVGLGASLQATGRYSKSAVDGLVQNANALSKATTKNNTDIVQATRTVSLFAQKLGPGELQQAQKAVIALSNATGLSMEAAGLVTGKALGSTTNALSRYGIVLGKTTDEHKRLAELVSKTNAMFAVAEANTKTVQGSMEALKNSYIDLEVEMGKVLIEGLNLVDNEHGLKGTIDAMTQSLKDNEVQWVREIRVIIAVGNTILQFTRFVGASIELAVSSVLTGIVSMVDLAAHAIQSSVNNAIMGMNTLISLANHIPGVKMGGIGQVNALGGLDKTTGMLGDWTKEEIGNAYGAMQSASQGWKNVFAPIKSLDVAFTGPQGEGQGITGSKKKGSSHDANFIAAVNAALQEQIQDYNTLSTLGPAAYDKMKMHMEAVKKVIDAHLKVSQAIKDELVHRIELTEQLKQKTQGLLEVIKTQAEAKIAQGSLAAYLLGGVVGQKQFDQAAAINQHIQDTPALRDNADLAKRYTLAEQQKNLANDLKAQQIAYNDQIVIAIVDQERLNVSLGKGRQAYNNLLLMEQAEAFVKQSGTHLSEEADKALTSLVYDQLKDTQATKEDITAKLAQTLRTAELTGATKELNAAKMGFTYNKATQQFELKDLDLMTQSIAAQSAALAASQGVWDEHAKKQYADALSLNALTKALDDTKAHLTLVMDAAKKMGDSFANAFEGIVLGTTTVKDAIRTLLLDIAKMVYEQTAGKMISSGIAGLIGKIFGGIGGGGAGNGVANAIGEFANGNIALRASGGPVSAGMPYIVGEKGPELMIPRSGGTIIPNGLGGNVIQMHQYFTIQTIDSASFEGRLAEHARFIGNVSVQAVQRQQNRMGSRGIMERSRG